MLLELLRLIPLRYYHFSNVDSYLYQQGLAILQTENWRDRQEMIHALADWIDQHDVRLTEIEVLQ